MENNDGCANHHPDPLLLHQTQDEEVCQVTDPAAYASQQDGGAR